MQQPQRIYKGTRQEQIYLLLKERKGITIDELVNELYASPATIRRDLDAMEKAGFLKRIYGGAILVDSVASETAQELRENDNSDKKKIIANLMDRFFTNNQSIFIDSSTTARFLPPVLAKYTGLVCITNSIRTANKLLYETDASVHLAGGKIAKNSSSTHGVMAIDYLNSFNADIALIACRGVSSKSGCTVVNTDQAATKRAMIKNARMSILLCDSTKFETSYLVTCAEFSDFDYFVTDKMPTGELQKAITQTGCKIIAYE